MDDYFTPLHERGEQGVYFYRINGYNEEIKQFLIKYDEAARTSGAVIEGRIPNPTEQNLAYYQEMMGMSFQLDRQFFDQSLMKWLPRMSAQQRQNVTTAMFDTLDEMREQGKNDSILRNTYIKFMCWMYYKFERLVGQLGADKLPKILYEGEVSNHELKMLLMLSKAGCDILLVQHKGDLSYLKLDAKSQYSCEWKEAGMTAFLEHSSIAVLRKEKQEQVNRERMYGKVYLPCTNAWMTGDVWKDARKIPADRGRDTQFFYNCFCRIKGVEDKLTYLNELYQFYLEMEKTKRNRLILEHGILAPTPEEIAFIQRGNYANVQQMAAALSQNLRRFVSTSLQGLMQKAFTEQLLEEAKTNSGSLHRLMNRAVYLLCWLRRYQSTLFAGWSYPQVSCVCYLGTCKNENEASFLRLLARLPVDVLLFSPDRTESDCLEDDRLYEINYEDSMKVEHFPQTEGTIQMGTAAYHAEQELDTILYDGESGIYRNQQYKKANVLTLKVMYEEIELLWNQELKYRPNFSVVNQVVHLPVIFSKVSGVRDGQISAYWAGIQKLIQEDTLVISIVPYISSTAENPIKPYVTEFWKNRRLMRQAIKNHRCYAYGFLREETQDYLLDKLQLLIEQNTIKGTFENGTEYTILAVALNLNKEILRLVQRFDFTKKNPKLIYIHTSEKMVSLEDGILIAFLNLVGFDIALFVPTGYQTVERYFRRPLMEEHQIGEYMYNLPVPPFKMNPSYRKTKWYDKIRGLF